MRTSREKNEFFSHSFLSYLFLFALAVGILAMIAYAFLSRQLRQQYDESYRSAVQSVAERVQSQFARLTASMADLSGTSWVFTYLYSGAQSESYEAQDVLEVQKQVDELTRMVALSGILEDVALAFPDKQMVISSKGRERIDSYFSEYVLLPDLGEAQNVLNSEVPMRWARVTDARVYGQQKDLLVCVATLPLYRRLSYGTMLIYIDELSLSRQLNPSGLLEGSEILLLDGEGEVLLGDAQTADLDVAREMIAQGNILSRDAQLTSYEQICVSPTGFNQWYCVAMVPQSRTLSVLRLMDWVSAAVIAVLLALGAMMSYLLARRSLKPILQLNALVARHKEETPWSSYADIERSFLALIHSVESGREDLERYRPMALRSLLNGFFNGSMELREASAELLQSLGLPQEGYLTVLALRGAQADAERCAGQLRALPGQAWTCAQSQDIMALLLATPRDVTDSLLPFLSHEARQALGVSRTLSWAQARLASQYAQAVASLQTLEARGLPTPDSARLELQEIAPDTSALCSALQDGDWPACEGEINRFMAQSMPLSHRHYGAYLLAAAMLRVSSVERLALSEAPEQIMLLDQPKEIGALLLRMARELCQNAARQQALRGDAFICAVHEYLQRNLSDPCLSVSAVAEALGRSEGYLSRTYKARTGENLSQAISRLRVEKAVQALNQGANVSEAAAEAGFDSVLTFRRAFRKVMNINPGDYQKQVNPIK